MKTTSVKTGFSQNKNEFEAVKEVFEKIKQDDIKLVVAFFDSAYDQQKINKAWKSIVPPQIPFIGSAVLRSDVPFFKIDKNIIAEGFKSGMAAISIASDKIDVAVELMKNIKDNWENESSNALNEAVKKLGMDLKKNNSENHFGILMCDTGSSKEDGILENLYAKSGLTFVGGGSVGKMNLGTWICKSSILPGHIHTNEGVFSDAGVLALVRCDAPFKIELITNFSPTNIKFVVTKAEGLLIHELNGNPATEEYIKAIGVPKWKLGITRVPNMSVFSNNLLGLMIKDKAYIRLIGTAQGNSLRMASPVKEGQALYLMKKEDILQTTQESINIIQKEMNSISGMILFHCGMRALEADKMKKLNDLFNLMNIAPLVGGCTFREYYGWLTMEYSLVLLAFGE